MSEKHNSQYIRMTQTPVNRLIVSLAIPTIISMLVTNIYNMADTYFVGTIGTSATAATGVVVAIMAILQAFGFMFGHGAGSNISRLLGSENKEGAREYGATSFWLSIFVGVLSAVLGVLFLDSMLRLMGSTDTILPYARIYGWYILIAAPAFTASCVCNNILRYEGMAFFAMLGLTAGAVLNIFGDYLFVRIMNRGIAGAGLSTTISQYISLFILILPFAQGKTQSKLNIRYFKGKYEYIKNIVTCGLPSLARQGLNSISTMILNSSASLYGDAAVAAISIATRVVNFMFCIAIGIGQGLQPVAAFNYGAKYYSRVKEGMKFALMTASSLMLVLALATFFSADVLVRLFRDDAEVMAIGKVALRFLCVSFVFMPIASYGSMLFQAIGESGIATILSILRSGGILIPMILLLSNLLGLRGLETAQAISEIVSGLLAIPFILRSIHRFPKDFYG
ncbi:MATE family efflux transporter [Bulleidia sp. zg-1006]|uniref:MATE family efflux transporter n=1 Tax=Bulleidia sp. zg-1006 TaxID=2806552 RepID=UPI00193AD11E|nr:MATE family efflux transporter [Bulleidia sp. zg-1006]QRG86315.1 MATE family efflux transporter [Bulleidia sp. zg-1006]